MVTKPTGRPRGRPSLPIKNDKDRYVLSFLEAKSLLLRGNISKSKLSKTLVAMQFGQLETSEANIKAYIEGARFQVVAPQLSFRGDPGSKEFRNRSVFNLISDDRMRKIRAIIADRNSEDFEWFGGMVIAWKEALSPKHRDPAVLHRICVLLGEEEFFLLVLKPWFDAAWGYGPIPALQLPDFIPHDAT